MYAWPILLHVGPYYSKLVTILLLRVSCSNYMLVEPYSIRIVTRSYVKSQGKMFPTEGPPTDPSGIAWGLRGYTPQVRSHAPSSQGLGRARARILPLLAT